MTFCFVLCLKEDPTEMSITMLMLKIISYVFFFFALQLDTLCSATSLIVNNNRNGFKYVWGASALGDAGC